MKRITVRLDENVVRWARARAAQQQISVSRLVEDLLRDHMIREQDYEAAMHRYLSVRPTRLSTGGAYPSRDEVHER